MRPQRRSLILGLSLACPAWALGAADQPFLDELRMQTPAYMVDRNRFTVEAGMELSHYVDPQGSVAVFAASALPYYSGLRGVDALGKSDRYIARLRGRGFDEGLTVTPRPQQIRPTLLDPATATRRDLRRALVGPLRKPRPARVREAELRPAGILLATP